MPAYPWLFTKELDFRDTSAKLRGLKTLGATYSEREVKGAEHDARNQAKLLARELEEQGVSQAGDYASKEIVALIAYLQRLGRDIKGEGD
jgi:cytochrome c oxidase cbb3-type subunit I/II